MIIPVRHSFVVLTNRFLIHVLDIFFGSLQYFIEPKVIFNTVLGVQHVHVVGAYDDAFAEELAVVTGKL